MLYFSILNGVFFFFVKGVFYVYFVLDVANYVVGLFSNLLIIIVIIYYNDYTLGICFGIFRIIRIRNLIIFILYMRIRKYK